MSVRVLLVGGYPPPWGGILVHIKRLQDYCNTNNLECFVFDTIHRKKIDYPNSKIFNFGDIIKILLFRKSFDIVHIHVSGLKNNFWIYIIVKFFSKSQIFITIHGGRFSNFARTFKIRQIKKLKRIFDSVDLIITVSYEQKQSIYSMWPELEQRVKTIPAFIFPKEDGSRVQDDFFKFKKKAQPDHLLITSGYITQLYGYEMLISFLQKYPKVAGIFVFYSTNNSAYKENIIKKINELENATFFEDLESETFNWLLHNSNVYVRNTSTDGDSVAIREAMYWNTIVLASNCVHRPESVKEYAFNNLSEFTKIFNNYIRTENKSSYVKMENYAEEIINLYKDLKQFN